MAIRETVADPDPVRLHYREVLIAVVSEIVRGLQAPQAANVRAIIETRVPSEALVQLTDLALDDLRNLHEGNISRIRLRLSEYHAWRSKF